MNRHEGHGAERDERDGTSEPDGCATFAPLLEAFHHHALDPDTTRSVAEHATGCAACAAALERFAATDRLIAAAPMALPGPELRQHLAARIAAAMR
ncbi:MAG TPA: zf-HC2 domain-containing protein, partial [Ktedonobacterales bacterium]|nr:zf-HC2 domain-containing protein [Ktedonobacterales bacterium]